jgi:4-oxalomesaconate tautomerase
MKASSQTAVPCLLMRGGTSKGPFYKASDLPTDMSLRDKVLLAAMGSPDKRQIDGLGGAHPLTSKVGIVSKSKVPGVALDFMFAQLQPDKETVDTTPNCGNMLAAVVPFALETGMLEVQGDQSTFRVLTLNTDMQCDITVDTRGGMVQYEGGARIDGAPGTSAPVTINFLNTAGSVCSGLLPTGRVKDTLTVTGAGFESFTLDVTCIDNGMPLVIFKASDVGSHECRYRPQNKDGSTAIASVPVDGLGRCESKELSQNDAHCTTAKWRCYLHSQLYSACVP